MFLQVWKVKKAFKIQIFWKGGKPTFQVRCSAQLCRLCRIVCRIFGLTFYFLLLQKKTVWKIRWVGAEDGGVRHAGKIADFTVGGGRERDAHVLKLWRWLCFSAGHEVSVIPAVPAVHRRSRVRPHFPAVQEVGGCVCMWVTAVQHNWLSWRPDCSSVLAGTRGWSTVW